MSNVTEINNANSASSDVTQQQPILEVDAQGSTSTDGLDWIDFSEKSDDLAIIQDYIDSIPSTDSETVETIATVTPAPKKLKEIETNPTPGFTYDAFVCKYHQHVKHLSTCDTCKGPKKVYGKFLWKVCDCVIGCKYCKIFKSDRPNRKPTNKKPSEKRPTCGSEATTEVTGRTNDPQSTTSNRQSCKGGKNDRKSQKNQSTDLSSETSRNTSKPPNVCGKGNKSKRKPNRSNKSGVLNESDAQREMRELDLQLKLEEKRLQLLEIKQKQQLLSQNVSLEIVDSTTSPSVVPTPRVKQQKKIAWISQEYNSADLQDTIEEKGKVYYYAIPDNIDKFDELFLNADQKSEFKKFLLYLCNINSPIKVGELRFSICAKKGKTDSIYFQFCGKYINYFMWEPFINKIVDNRYYGKNKIANILFKIHDLYCFMIQNNWENNDILIFRTAIDTALYQFYYSITGKKYTYTSIHEAVMSKVSHLLVSDSDNVSDIIEVSTRFNEVIILSSAIGGYGVSCEAIDMHKQYTKIYNGGT